MQQYEESRGGPSRSSQVESVRSVGRHTAMRPIETMKGILYNGVGEEVRAGGRVCLRVSSVIILTSPLKNIIIINRNDIMFPYHLAYPIY